MCGIGGVFGENPSISSRHVQLLAKSLMHRGPDECRTLLTEHCALVSTRLAIVDPTGSHQPLSGCSPSIQVVVSGEIYNHKMLRKSLLQKGHTFTSEGDGEVIAHLYEDYGMRFAEKLRGAFAIAIFDASEQSMFLCRDPMGEKPLVYMREREHVFFASEIRALPGIKSLQPQPAAINAYLQFGFIPEPMTLFFGVEKVPAGAILRFALSGAYSQYDFAGTHCRTNTTVVSNMPPSISGLYASLVEAVEQQLDCDANLGIALSDGIDSQLLARLAGPRATFDTFSVTFDWLPSEHVQLAMATSEAVGGRHNQISISRSQYADLLLAAMTNLAEPIADWTSAAYLAIMRSCRERGIRVLLTGHGPDEMLLSYDWTRLALKSSPDSPGESPQTLLARTYAAFNPEYSEASRGLVSICGERRHIGSKLFLEALAGGTPRDTLRGWLMQGYLRSNGLMQLDSLGLSEHVEVRMPYVDVVFAKKLMDLDRLAPDHRGTKRLLYRLATRAGVQLDYRPKVPFYPGKPATAPEVLRLARESLPGGSLVVTGILDPREVQRLFDCVSRSVVGADTLFRLLVLEVWFSQARLSSGLE